MPDSPQDDPNEIIATISASQPRRAFALLVLLFLGLLLLYMAFARPPDALGWQALLLLLGGGALWLAERLRQATRLSLLLTRDALRDSEGRVLVRVAEIKTVDRGFLAFKPSNGFMVTSTVADGRAWAPGLWWRIGRRIGIGGVTSAGQSKAMAEILTALMAQR